MKSLERHYENVLVEMVGFQRSMAQQDGVMQSLIAYFLGSESGKSSFITSSFAGNSGEGASGVGEGLSRGVELPKMEVDAPRFPPIPSYTPQYTSY